MSEEMGTTLPFLTAYDPPGTSEGSLDPLGLYQIADQLAVLLVPAVRERMLRIRFLTAMAVGAVVTEGLDDDPEQRDASPYLVWEWLVVEAMVRSLGDEPGMWGVPGTQVARQALNSHSYLDARSYLKTPRIFGFNGVYKRLAVNLGVVDVHLAPGPHAEGLVDAWARGMGSRGYEGARATLARWTDAVRRSLRDSPPRTRPGWNRSDWETLARAFEPNGAKGRERRYLRSLLLDEAGVRMGALTPLWELQAEFSDEEYGEEELHHRLEERAPQHAPLLAAIRAYEVFSRKLQDGFDLLRAIAGEQDARGFVVQEVGSDAEFCDCVHDLHGWFDKACGALGDSAVANPFLQNRFAERFGAFAQPMQAGDCAAALCAHHETVQKAKSAAGKRAWFDRIGQDRIYIRQGYREQRRLAEPGRYVHDYRGWPIRRFYVDLVR